jgi:hypothetical protein
MKYKIGQILKVKEGCEGECYDFEKNKGKFIKIAHIEDGYRTYDILDKNKEVIDWCDCFKDEHLEPITKTLRDMEVGDILVNERGSETKVLEVLINSFLMSCLSGFKNSWDWFTFEEAEEEGWKLKTQEEPEVEEMTVADVCKELGREVKIIK